MHAEDMTPVLRCDQCNKPFDKPSTLKRHGYYCRSRKSAPTGRTRSCTACVKAKTRCDNRRPECSRCIAKHAYCRYPSNSGRNVTLTRQLNRDELPEQQRLPTSPPLGTPEDHASKGASADQIDLFLDGTAPELADIDWNGLDLDIDNLDPPMIEEIMEEAPSEVTALIRHSTPSQHTPQTRPTAASSQSSIPMQLTSTPRSLVKRLQVRTEPQRVNGLIRNTLLSYSHMMMHPDALPPFIHSRAIAIDAESHNMEPLINCVGLMHMIGSNVRSSRKLFWRNVRVECERWRAEILEMSKWEKVAALQALFIYILVRLEEGETEYNNLDSLLITTVTILSQRLAWSNMPRNYQPEAGVPGLNLDWRQWVMEESTRRLCIVYRIMDMIIHFEPAMLCDLYGTGLLLAPLPAKKQLWEASDERLWANVSKNSPGLEVVTGLTTGGTLIRIDNGDACHIYKPRAEELLTDKERKRDATNWQEWASGMDGLGGLIMLAAAMSA